MKREPASTTKAGTATTKAAGKATTAKAGKNYRTWWFARPVGAGGKWAMLPPKMSDTLTIICDEYADVVLRWTIPDAGAHAEYRICRFTNAGSPARIARSSAAPPSTDKHLLAIGFSAAELDVRRFVVDAKAGVWKPRPGTGMSFHQESFYAVKGRKASP